MKTTELTGYRILSFVDPQSGSSENISNFRPYAIQRDSDGEIFTIGDRFINKNVKPGTKAPHGEITGFELLEGTVFIRHTWSGIGFSLNSIEKDITLPSRFQINDKVVFIIQGKDSNFGCFDAVVKGVHFYKGKVKYDLELQFGQDDFTRIYNIDSCFVEPIKN
jgi:hypothetical protein